jgi:hypothetical protein
MVERRKKELSETEQLFKSANNMIKKNKERMK